MQHNLGTGFSKTGDPHLLIICAPKANGTSEIVAKFTDISINPVEMSQNSNLVFETRNAMCLGNML